MMAIVCAYAALLNRGEEKQTSYEHICGQVSSIYTTSAGLAGQLARGRTMQINITGCEYIKRTTRTLHTNDAAKPSGLFIRLWYLSG